MMAYCIQQIAKPMGIMASKSRPNASVPLNTLHPTFEDRLSTTAPTVELSKDDLWLNVTSLMYMNTYYATHGTLKEFAISEYIHTRYS